MSLLSYSRLVQLVEQGVISNVKPEQINSSSIDICLGTKFFTEDCNVYEGHHYVSLSERKPLRMSEWEFDELHQEFILAPGEFVLAHSRETFNLPNNISAEYKLKSSMARIGIEHLNAGWCDAGWNGSVLTLELKNMTRNHHISLRAGDRIGQMVFFEHEPVPEGKCYASRGRYNGDSTVTGVKP